VLLLMVTGSCGKSDNPDVENISGTNLSEISETQKETTTSEMETTTTKTTEPVTTEPTTEEETIKVPDFRGMNFFDAKKQYEFNFKIRKYLPAEEYPDFKSGDIISQEVEAGTELKKGDTIFIEICKGEIIDNIIECPDLIGKEYKQAVKEYGDIITIEKIGEDYHSHIAEGRIIEQDVEASSKIKKDTVIKVKVSMGEIPTETAPPETAPPVEIAPPEPVQPAEPVVSNIHFILNTDTNCIHTKADCSAAQKILPENYSEIDISNSELANYANVYWACGKCSKEYSNILPKF
nr:PASTA domain-containing protein [Ruminococcus sp.]